MQTIVHIKDGLWVNLTTIAFLFALTAFSVWFDHRSNGAVSPITWFFGLVMLLCCYFPITSIREPKSCQLGIDGEFLVWRIRAEGSKAVQEERFPLNSIRALEFIIPQEAGSSSSRLDSCAQLFFVTVHRNRHELPSDFFPGVHRNQIVAAIQQHVPGVQVVEKLGEAI